MEGEWARLRLAAVCSKIGSGATPRGGSSVYLDHGPVALIRSQNVYNDGFHHDGLAFIGDLHAEQLSNVEVFDRDVLLNITGDSVARACQVDPAVLPARVNQHVAILRPDPEILDPAFLRYFLVTPAMQAKLLSWAGSGGTRKALTKGMIESFEVPAPRIHEQRAVAHILGTLDDKIELNRRMNETLEGMARALFKSWFVDFDPVRAKVDGRWRPGESLPGLPADLYDLFPDRLVQSELGEVPEEWEVVALGSLAGQKRDSVKPDEIDGGTPHIGLGHMPQRSLGLSDWELGDDIGSNKYRFVRGDILFGKLRPYFHKVGIAPVDGVCSTDIVVIQPAEAELRDFVLSWVSSDLFVAYTNAGSTGTRMPRTSWKYMARHERPLPEDPLPLAARFADLVAPAVERIVSGIQEARRLAGLRDTLLPMLVSGKLRVPDAEQMVERAT